MYYMLFRTHRFIINTDNAEMNNIINILFTCKCLKYDNIILQV